MAKNIITHISSKSLVGGKMSGERLFRNIKDFFVEKLFSNCENVFVNGEDIYRFV